MSERLLSALDDEEIFTGSSFRDLRALEEEPAVRSVYCAGAEPSGRAGDAPAADPFFSRPPEGGADENAETESARAGGVWSQPFTAPAIIPFMTFLKQKR